MTELLVPALRKNGKPYALKKTYSYHIPGIEPEGIPFVVAFTKGEARSILKIMYNLNKLPPGTRLVEST